MVNSIALEFCVALELATRRSVGASSKFELVSIDLHDPRMLPGTCPPFFTPLDLWLTDMQAMCSAHDYWPTNIFIYQVVIRKLVNDHPMLIGPPNTSP